MRQPAEEGAQLAFLGAGSLGHLQKPLNSQHAWGKHWSSQEPPVGLNRQGLVQTGASLGC